MWEGVGRLGTSRSRCYGTHQPDVAIPLIARKSAGLPSEVAVGEDGADEGPDCEDGKVGEWPGGDGEDGGDLGERWDGVA